MYVPLKLPPGVYRNGTEYQSAGRWYDSNLVRWRNGALMPIGGWRAFSTSAVSGTPRALQVWRDNSGAVWIAVGTHTKLYVYSGTGTRYDITPTTFTTGRADAGSDVGYGRYTFGSSQYGIARPVHALTGVSPATTWKLDTWGQNLVGCCDSDGKLVEWSLNTANKAATISNAPTGCSGLIVSEERFLFALGAGGNPRKVQWSDQESNTTWTATATNQAGDIELQTAGSIVAARRVRGGVLILTDIDAHLGRYVGPPYIYGFERVGTGCGLVGANAIVASDVGAVWMSAEGFYTFDGYVKPIACDVVDYVFGDINRTQISKVVGVHNAAFSEVTWYYPSAESTENDRYVTWNYIENTWYLGELSRTAAAGQGVLPFPLAVDASGNIYEHEVGWAYDGATPYAESGPLEIGNGDNVMHVRKLIPDDKTLGDVQAQFKLKFFPDADEQSVGPYTLAEQTDVRFTARQVKLRVEGVAAADWRVGVPRLEAVPAGKR